MKLNSEVQSVQEINSGRIISLLFLFFCSVVWSDLARLHNRVKWEKLFPALQDIIAQKGFIYFDITFILLPGYHCMMNSISTEFWTKTASFSLEAVAIFKELTELTCYKKTTIL